MSKQVTIIQIMPVWADMETIIGLTGLPDNHIRGLYNEHKVRARKSAEKTGAKCVFNVQDVLDWMEHEAPQPQPFKVPEVRNG